MALHVMGRPGPSPQTGCAGTGREGVQVHGLQCQTSSTGCPLIVVRLLAQTPEAEGSSALVPVLARWWALPHLGEAEHL